MTPKEKAEELVLKFYRPERNIYKVYAIKLALITVVEVLQAIESGTPIESQWIYWDKVKTEIKRM